MVNLRSQWGITKGVRGVKAEEERVTHTELSQVLTGVFQSDWRKQEPGAMKEKKGRRRHKRNLKKTPGQRLWAER